MNRMASIGTMAAAVAVVLLMCLPVMPAFAASGYTSALTCEDSAVGAEYLSADLFADQARHYLNM